MKLDKDDIEEIKDGLGMLNLRGKSHSEALDGTIPKADKNTAEYQSLLIICRCLDTIGHLHASISILANDYKAQGRVAEAKEVRGLVE